MVVGYAQPGKEKSRVIVEAFVAGCGGRLSGSATLEPGPAAFYGVVGLEPLWRAARERGEYFYGDNSFFDAARGTHFRFAKNQLQAEPGAPDWGRFKALGLKVKPWRRDGRHIVVAMQSDHFMKEVAAWPGGAQGWQESVITRLKQATERLIVVRHWSRDKASHAASLRRDMDGAWALVTHASAAANEALLDGIPVFVTGQCPALRMGLSQLEGIENPRRPDGREEWAAGLAALQWTIQELRSGLEWRALNA
jgi:hypothetical protein